jgi:hypothetical protein
MDRILDDDRLLSSLDKLTISTEGFADFVNAFREQK